VSWQRENEASTAYLRRAVGGGRARDGEWALGLRSADVSGRNAALYAQRHRGRLGPDAELAETQLKLQALLAAWCALSQPADAVVDLALGPALARP